jgi:2-succinyl-6-hydroxy-2,4-cyclohexadiene-1-carboxylate synthase
MRLVLVHGFTQTGASWDRVRRHLSVEHDVVAPDVPVGEDLWSTADQLGEIGGAGAWIGYSMGGRLALHLALRRPDLVERLVLVGATGGIDDAEERAVRRAADEELAVSIESDGVDAFLERWLAQPLFAGLTEAGPRQRDPLVLTATLRRLGTGTQQPLWDQLEALTMPVLVVAGERDHKFTALGHRLVDAIGGNAELALVPDAGHACHLERPEAFVAAVAPFVTTARSPGPATSPPPAAAPPSPPARG